MPVLRLALTQTMLKRSLFVFSVTCVLFLWDDGTGFGFQQPESAFQESKLTDTNFGMWRDRIKAKESELLWQDFPWQTSFFDGLHQSAAENKPLLLWVMNGHPLGCT